MGFQDASLGKSWEAGQQQGPAHTSSGHAVGRCSSWRASRRAGGAPGHASEGGQHLAQVPVGDKHCGTGKEDVGRREMPSESRQYCWAGQKSSSCYSCGAQSPNQVEPDRPPCVARLRSKHSLQACVLMSTWCAPGWPAGAAKDAGPLPAAGLEAPLPTHPSALPLPSRAWRCMPPCSLGGALLTHAAGGERLIRHVLEPVGVQGLAGMLEEQAHCSAGCRRGRQQAPGVV